MQRCGCGALSEADLSHAKQKATGHTLSRFRRILSATARRPVYEVTTLISYGRIFAPLPLNFSFPRHTCVSVRFPKIFFLKCGLPVKNGKRPI